MAAEATFIIRAVDATKAAFASVQKSLAKTFQSDGPAKFAAKFLGITAVLGMVSSEIRRLIENIDAIPNVPAKTLESINELKYNLFKGREELDKFILGGITLFANFGTKIGETIGALIYGFDAVADSQKKVNEEAVKFSRLPLQTKLLEISNGLSLIGKSQVQLAAILKDEADALSNFAKTGVVDLGNLNSAYLKTLKLKADSKGVSQEDRTNAEIAAAEARSKITVIQMSLEDKIHANRIKMGADLLAFDRRNLSLKERINLVEEKRKSIISTPIPPMVFGDPKGMQSYIDWQNKVMVNNEQIIALQIESEQTGKQAGQMIASGFEEAVFSGKKLSEVLKALALDLVRLVFQKQVTEVAATGIGKFINTALGFKAMGGPVTSGSPYVVGEKGPELFVPNSSGSIIPNSKMGSGSGGAGGTNVNVTYNIASGVSRSDLAPILEQQRKLLKAEIPDMVRRGGGYRAAFA
jgi:hypothetical protein